MREATRILQTLVTPAEPGAPLHQGPVFAAPFHVPADPAGAPFSYGRYEQPGWTALERTISVIETGEGLPGDRLARTLCFGSGMAAISSVLATVLRPGDAVVLPAGGYFSTRLLAEGYFATLGVEVRTYAPFLYKADSDLASEPRSNESVDELLDGARLLWIESPGNPSLEITDIAELAQKAHAAGVLVACDNTTATPLGQNVLALGADFSIVSDTKLMTGHSDLLVGHVALTDDAWYERLLSWRNLAGSGPGPMEAWLALRSLATLPLRHERSTANALAVAEWLHLQADRQPPVVQSVLYPGLPSHPGHSVAARQMRSFGPVVSFTLPSWQAAERFLEVSRLITNATSFGGITTTAERRARWGHDAVPEGLIRLSVGCEAVEDLLEDLSHAMQVIA